MRVIPKFFHSIRFRVAIVFALFLMVILESLGIVFIYFHAHGKILQYSNDSLLGILLVAIISIVLASVFLAVFLSKTIARPIEIINEQTTKIAAGDYSMTNDISGADELSQLAHSINELSHRIEDSTETISAQGNRLKSVLTHMDDGVLLANQQGKVTLINQSAAKFLGLSVDEALNQNVLTLLHLENQKQLTDLFDDQVDLQVKLEKSGSREERTVQTYISPIKGQSGTISGIVLVLHDITKQAKVDAERRRFVSNVSHELRTPLTSVRSYVEALVDGAVDDPETAQSFLHVVQDETERMSRMINDLLELSRLDQGTMEIKPELVNLNSFFGFILDRFDMILEQNLQNGSESKHYRIAREICKEDIWVEIDHDKLTQVLDNLINNAIKYSPDGGVITASLNKHGQTAIISITDQGLGIPKEDLHNIFTRFFRVDKSRSRAQGGSGLGLAISKEVIEHLNGRIWVNSVENHGSTFSIALECVSDETLLDTEND